MARRQSIPRLIAGVTLVGILVLLGYFIVLQTRAPKSYVTSGFKPLPQGFHSHGIDVSRYQGTIDWDVLRDSSSIHISFVYCKSTEGITLVDPFWKRNREALKNRNIPHGAYHYFKPKTDAAAQAHFFLKHYKSKQSDLPPVIDIEEETTNLDLLLSEVLKWMSIVENATGKRPIIYTNYYLFEKLFEDACKGEQFWIANYSDRPSRMQDSRILIWQYTDQGKVPGITSFVDLNVSKIKFGS
jgi:lysozyme